MTNISLPGGVQTILRLLERRGFEAYAVGGCVRDSLLGLEPQDWDICTSAKPDQMLACFAEYRVIETGLKHGTVTVMLEGEPYEVTTFRIDGTYSDNRRPDFVTFTADLREDLSRRDFTVNAMAYGPGGLADPFGGVQDLQNRLIRCVGRPDKRFAEDALRILRGLRFASVYGFSIEQQTAQSIHKNKDLLDNIARERVQSELCKLLMGREALPVLLEFSDVMTAVIPELQPCIGFQQNNPYHQYDVYQHMVRAVAADDGDDLAVKLALLLHDIGKPQCYTEDQRGGHFHGHSLPSRDIAEAVTRRLRLDNKTRQAVLDLVLYHDSAIEPCSKAVRRWLNKIGEPRFRQLLRVQRADALAHSEYKRQEKLDRCAALEQILEQTLAQKQCFSIKDLAINGRDLLALGVPQGRQVGGLLQALLEEVVNGRLENSRAALLAAAEEKRNQPSPPPPQN